MDERGISSVGRAALWLSVGQTFESSILLGVKPSSVNSKIYTQDIDYVKCTQFNFTWSYSAAGSASLSYLNKVKVKGSSPFNSLVFSDFK